jgi:hypothetical protein
VIGLVKTFVFGLILGVLGAGALVWYVPAVDLHRERSLVSVQANGGNVEEFRINLPRDRIMVGLPNQLASIPASLDWPGEQSLGDMQAEIFKIRDANDTVIGVGSRIASASEETGPFIEWALHLPARGTMYMKMGVTPSADGVRDGRLVAGTRDFLQMSGSLREQFVSGIGEDDGSQGRILLSAALVRNAEVME